MLVLSRKVGECIVIGDSIVLRVVGVRGEQVRLGIDAPRSVAIHRKELLDQVVAENIEAAATARDNGNGKAADSLLPKPAKE